MYQSIVTILLTREKIQNADKQNFFSSDVILKFEDTKVAACLHQKLSVRFKTFFRFISGLSSLLGIGRTNFDAN